VLSLDIDFNFLKFIEVLDLSFNTKISCVAIEKETDTIKMNMAAVVGNLKIIMVIVYRLVILKGILC